MKVIDFQEHEDGTVDMNVEMTQEESDFVMSLGMRVLLKSQMIEKGATDAGS